MGFLKNIGNKFNELDNRLKKQAREAAERANESFKKAERAIADAAKKADAFAKKEAQKLLDKAKSDFNKLKDLDKKIKKGLHNLAGKVRNVFKKLVGKTVLKMVANSLKANIHGMATRLYPAIAPISDLKAKRFSPKFVPKSKVIYEKLLAKWIEFGGDKNKLDDAIKQGSSKRIFKFKNNPYLPKGLKHSFDGDYSNAEGEPNTDESGQFDKGADVTPPLSTDEQNQLSEAGVDEVSGEEKHKGWHSFMAFIKNLFHKHKAEDESPYEEPAPGVEPPDDAKNFADDLKADKPNLDALQKTAGDAEDIMNEYSPKKTDSKATGPSKVINARTPSKQPSDSKKQIIGAVAGAVVGGAIGYIAMPKKRKLSIPIGLVAGAGIGFAVGKMLNKHSDIYPHVEEPKNPNQLKIN